MDIDDITHSGFTWDNAHNMTAQVNWTNSPWNISFTYDAINRLTNANAAYGYGSVSFTYDANGNQLTGGGNTYSYTSGTNRQSQKAWTDPTYGPMTETASYTSTGNVTGLNITGCCSTFTGTYNAANRLATELQRGGASDTLSYDFKGERTIKACCGSPSTYFTYDQGGTLLEEVNNGYYIDYIYLDGRLIGLQENQTSGTPPVTTTALYSAITYLNGTVANMLDSGKNIVWGYYPYPYGLEDTVGGTISQSLRFPGQYSDGDFPGIYYNLNRDYYTQAGRYLQVDPIGLAGGTNPYVYAADNPVTNTDQVGLDTNGLTDTPQATPIPQATGSAACTADSGGIKQQCISECTEKLLLGPGRTDLGGDPFWACVAKCMARHRLGPWALVTPVTQQ